MSHLIVITFADSEEAARVRESLSKGQKIGRISLDDSAIVVKDEEGKVHVKNELDRGIKVGALGGGALGLLIGGIFFPIGGMLIGAAAGAVIGKLANVGIENKFVKQVSDDLAPGSSALFFIIRDADPNYALATLREYEGNVYHTTLSAEAEAELRRVLSEKQ